MKKQGDWSWWTEEIISLNHKLYHPSGKGGRDLWGGGNDGRKGRLNGSTGYKQKK